ncbi:MAG: hypothetical protein ABSG30_00640 [Steroidobacteraceae bacterium]
MKRVSSSNSPHSDVNPNTGAAEGSGLTRNVARDTLFSTGVAPRT